MKTSGKVSWEATLSHRTPYHKKTRYQAYVQDATAEHLDLVHRNQQCAFEKSWKAFNLGHGGTDHQTLSWARFILGMVLLIGVGCCYFVYRLYVANRRGSKYFFHIIVLVKFAIQDMPQQICIVLYMLGWYNTQGLRCQMCLFDPGHCEEEHPFHFFNSLACVFTLASSLANQLLVTPVSKKSYTEDDICLQYTSRICVGCVSVLPFTTGMLLSSSQILTAAMMWHIVVALPCVIGWLTIAGCVCYPICVCCDDDMVDWI